MRLHTSVRGSVTERHRTPLLFVHGAWHASWCWEENFIPAFVDEGYACHAFDFRGHGQSEGREQLLDFHFADYVEDLGQAAAAVGQKPVLIAHSMGGLVAQKFAQDHEVAGIALLAPIPLAGVGYGYARDHPLAFLKAVLTRNGGAMIRGEKLARSLFFSPDIPDDVFRGYYGKLQDESFRALSGAGRGIEYRPLKNGPPVLVVEAGRDAVIPSKNLAETARLYGTEPVRLDSLAHDLMLDVEWKKTADLLRTWLSDRGF